ncbi:ABC transporter [Phytophthora megakarya]|uniref:ABC transporter n=1 Tax=Phytophthora megakarya TaxID=4795 RepID=A0A225VAY4_9STRA|nr:ABC transporter [Phytophthora megakarya]
MGSDSSGSELPLSGDVSPDFDRVWFDDWESLDAYMAEYLRSTNQKYRVRTSTPASTRNNKIRERAKWSETDLIPEDAGPYYKKYECTHAKDDRKRGKGKRTGHVVRSITHAKDDRKRGKGKRTGHVVRSTNCSAGIAATLMHDERAKRFRVKVTRSVYTHNHKVDPRIFERYASERRVDDEEVLGVVGDKRYITLADKKLTLKDVHNLVQRLKRERRPAATVEDRLEIVLRKFCRSRGNSATVFVDDNNIAQTITLQSQQMRRYFEAFPEVSRHAFDLLKAEYDLVSRGSCFYVVEQVQRVMYELKSPITSHIYHINKESYTCSCTFMRTRLLPCHHVMFLRRHLQKKNTIPVNHINPRWIIDSPANRPVDDSIDSDS